MTGSNRRRLRSLGPLVLGLAATVAITSHLVWGLPTPATRDRVTAEVAAPPSAVSLLGDPRMHHPGFEKPTLPPDIRPGDVATVRPWFSHGRWWAIFAVPADGHHLFALAGPRGPWTDTNIQVDDRVEVRIDAVVSGDHLVVAAAGRRSYRRDALRVDRFTWNTEADAWQLDPDYPIEVTDTGMVGEVQLAVTDDQQIWLARLDAGSILLANLDPSGSSSTPFTRLAGGVADTDVGSFALVADHHDLRLAWRSASRDQVSLASGDGTSWSVVDHQMWGAAGTGAIDAAVAGSDRPGTVFLLVPTSLAGRTSNDRAPSVVLVDLTGEVVAESVVAVAEDRLTDPVLVMAPEDGRVSVVAAVGPERAEPGAVTGPWTATEKQASITHPAFPPGSGEVLVESSDVVHGSLLAPTTVTSRSGLVVALIDPRRRSWITAQQAGSSAEETAVAASSVVLHDSFEGLAAGSVGPASWFREEDGPRSTMVVEHGVGRALTVAVDPTAKRTTACRSLPMWGSEPITIRAEVRAIGAGTSDARLLTVRGPNGVLVAVRRSDKGMVGHLAPGGRVDEAPLAAGNPVVITVRIDPTATSAVLKLDVVGADDTLRSTIPYLTTFARGSARVCVSPAVGDPAARIEVADLTVTRG